MDIKSVLEQEMVQLFYSLGKETGYWNRYFLKSVAKNGGWATARKILGKPLTRPAESKDFQAAIDAGRPDLTLENLVLQLRFKELFSSEELHEAERRLAMVPGYVRRTAVKIEELYPEELHDEHEYTDVAKKRIVVNAFERDLKLRAACLERHGSHCQVCNMSFADTYGEVGKGFIHLHHRKPMAGRSKDYQINPTLDLVPVCLNCHAMLHTSNPPLGVEELREKIARKKLAKGGSQSAI